MDERCIQGLDSLPSAARGCVLTIGNFDGVHVGHQRILMHCRMLARQEQCAIAALTFDPPPEFVLHPRQSPPLIMPPCENCRLLLKAGADLVVTARTTPEFLELAPQQFIDRIVIERFAPRHIVEGQDFFFGRARMGSVETLHHAGAEGGFVTHVMEPVTLMFGQGQRRVSSTLIRELIAEGDVSAANDCLGRKFTLYGTTVAGEGQGRLLDFPTVNLDPGPQVSPGGGVYAGKARIDDKTFIAAVSVGTKPTLHPDLRKIVIEAFLLDAAGDFYGKRVELAFHARLRNQRKFAGVDDLKRQIELDVQMVREMVR